MSNKSWLSKLILLPASKIFGMVVAVRNWMFDVRLLKQKTFDVPVLVVGNLSVGGTGKTPHVEFIVERLRCNYHIGILSRGYKRSTKGFVMASHTSVPADIGDEPYQMYHKFACTVPVAVCEDRVAGITELLKVDPAINLVVLDDAFQHRYVKPTVSVVLTDYSKPVFEDHLLPYGRLRESKRGLRRADIIVATKCPPKMSALEYSIFESNLNLIAYQRLFFSQLVYRHLKPVFPEAAPPVPPALDWLTADDMLLVVAGIGNPKPFVKFVKQFKPKVRVNIFSDHHNFTRKDMALLKSRFESMTGKRNFIITTEKDAVRLAACPYFAPQMRPYIFYLPIDVDFRRDENASFIEEVTRAIKRNTPVS